MPYKIIGIEEPFIGVKTKVKILCEKHNYEYSIKFIDFYNGKRCAKCGKVYKYTKEERAEQIQKRIDDENLPYEFLGFQDNPGEKFSNESKIKIKCNKCNYIWLVTIHSFFKGSTCLSCNKRRRYSKEERKEQIKNIILDEDLPYDFLGFKYEDGKESITSRYKVALYCKKHDYKWEAWLDSFVNRKTRCPLCRTSRGENEIARFLQKHGIKYIHNHSFDGCKYKQKLLFDFYLPEINMCIEYDGEQHFRPVSFGGMSEEDTIKKFEINKIRDEIKNKFCEENNIKLLRIKYCKKEELNNILTAELL